MDYHYVYWLWFFIICVILFIAFIAVVETQELHGMINNWVWIILLFVIIFFFISLVIYLYFRPTYVVPCVQPCKQEVIYQAPTNREYAPLPCIQEEIYQVPCLREVPIKSCLKTECFPLPRKVVTFNEPINEPCKKLRLSDLNPYVNKVTPTIYEQPCVPKCDMFSREKLPLSFLSPY